MAAGGDDGADVLERAPRLSVRVARVLSNEVAKGELKQGDRLPTEQALCKRFGVSRSVVREAIAELRSGGIVESRQGSGIFVAGMKDAAILRIDADHLRDRAVFQNVFELRAILETRGVGLAAVRATEAHRSAISEAFQRMRDAADGWGERGVSADLDFHRAVAAGSLNPYLASSVAMLTAQMRESIMFMRLNISDPLENLTATNIAEHEAVYDALMRREPDAAREAMRIHITASAQRLGYALDDGL